MPRKKSTTLTEVEQQIMEVLWDAGSGTVAEVTEALTRYKKVAFNTVQTVLRILEEKRYVRHKLEGRGFRYTAIVDRRQLSGPALLRRCTRQARDEPDRERTADARRARAAQRAHRKGSPAVDERGLRPTVAKFR